MQAVELRKQSIGVLANVVVVLLQDLAQELGLAVVDRLDDVLVVAREIEKAAALAWRAELGKNVFTCQRDKVIGRVELEGSAEMTEDPWRIVLELEVVLGGRSKLVASSVGVSVLGE